MGNNFYIKKTTAKRALVGLVPVAV